MAQFGFKNISAPTPATATWVFRAVLYVAGLGNIAIVAFTDLPDHLKLQLVSWASFATLAVHSASKMFGIPIPDNTPIPSQNVESLKTDKIEQP